jgi:sugar phosphate isomerase/epimerase
VRYALFSKLLADRSVAAAAETAADIGYGGLELMGRAPHLPPDTTVERAEEIRSILDANGLDVPCLATYTGGYVDRSAAEREAALEELESVLRLTDALDCSLVRHTAGGPPVREATASAWEEAVTWLRRAADRAADHDATLALEIHANRLCESAAAGLELCDRVGRENVGLIHDAGNMAIAGHDWGPETVRALGDRLVHVHLKNMCAVGPADDAIRYDGPDGARHFRHAHLDAGVVDAAAVLGTLDEVGYDGHVTLETGVDGAPRSVAARELDAARAAERAAGVTRD